VRAQRLGRDWHEVAACGSFGVYPVSPASASLESRDSADSRASGSARPRFAARRKIPAAALGLKQYLDRCGPVSKTSGKEDAAAPLGDSEPLSIQNSPRHAIPEVIQAGEDRAEVAAAVDRKEPRHILAKEPAGACLSQEPHDVPPQARPWVSQAAATPGNRVALARPPGSEKSPAGNKAGCS
jgi:hypothetical protein